MKRTASITYFAVATIIALLSIPTTAAAQDAAAGERVFLKCRTCHQIGEGARNLVGPQLNGIVGRAAAQVEGYAYSPALKESNLTWDAETLTAYLRNPREKVPRNRMIFPGLKKDTDIINVIAYLKQFSEDGPTQ